MVKKFRNFIEDCIAQADLVLLGLCLAASCFGLLLIASATQYSGSSRKVIVQAAAICIGVLCYVVFSVMDVDLCRECPVYPVAADAPWRGALR